jgi:hypothetical protein
MLNDDRSGRFQRDLFNFDLKNLTSFFSSDPKCERVDPAKRRMLKEKFEIAESYFGRFIANILKHFTDEKNFEAVRKYCKTLLFFTQ